MRQILTKQIHTISTNSIIQLYGFPEDWYKFSPLPQ